MTFSDQSAISAHYDTAHAHGSSRPDARHECEVCDRKFTEKRSLKRHLSSVHGVGEIQMFPCDVCTRVFKEKHHLKRHMSTVHRTDDAKAS